MNAYIKYIAPISLSALLVACGSSGGKGDNHKQSQKNKEQELPSLPTINHPSKTVTVKPVAPVKDQEKPEAPTLNKPSEEITVKPVAPVKEQEKPEAPTLHKPIEDMAVKPVAPVKELEKEADPVDIPTEINKLTNTWFAGGSSEYDKDGVRVYKLIENDRNYADDPNFKEKKLEYIQLKQGTNSTSDYILTLLDDNAYYGFYRDSVDMFKVNNNYIYSFNEKAENKGDLNQLVATYRGHFIYSLRSNPNLATTSDVHLTYTKGQAEGEIYSRQTKPGEQGRKLFDIKDNHGDIRLLELNPSVTDLDNSVHGEEVVVRKNSPDRIIIETHFINGQDGTENKHIVGKGGNEKYWGVMGLGKTEK